MKHREYELREFEGYSVEDAQDMYEWFGLFQAGLIDIPGAVSSLAEKRLTDLFGDGDTVEQLRLICDSFDAFQYAHQATMALYFCGFPDEYIEASTAEDTPLAATLRSIRNWFELEETEARSPATTPPRQRRNVAPAPSPIDATRNPQPNDDQEVEKYISIETPRSGGRRDFDWQDDALCAQIDPELFFPTTGSKVGNPKRVCGRCTVKKECANFALEAESSKQTGIWGGMDAYERKQLARDMRQEAERAIS